MSHQEKNVFISLISALIVSILYALYVFYLFQNGRFAGSDAGSLVGRSAFAMIVVGVGVRIVVQAIFSVIHTKLTQEKDRPVNDERDKLIELKGMQIAFITFSVGFLALTALLALNMLVPYTVILLTIAGLYLASIVADSVKIFLYRRGF